MAASMDVGKQNLTENQTEISNNDYFEMDLSVCIEKATDCLLLRDFEQCISVCNYGLHESKRKLERDSAVKGRCLLCGLLIQSLAEQDRWREVLPLITAQYQGIEACPATLIQLLVLLHAKVAEFAQCHAIASIWLKSQQLSGASETRQDLVGYSMVVETYVLHVLAPQNKWQETGPFIKSCTLLVADDVNHFCRLAEELKLEAEQKQKHTELQERKRKREMRHRKRNRYKMDKSSSRGNISQSNAVCSQANHMVTHHQSKLIGFVRRFGLYMSRRLSITLRVVYKIIFVGVCVYLITIQAQHGDLLSNNSAVWTIGRGLKRLMLTLIWPHAVRSGD